MDQDFKTCLQTIAMIFIFIKVILPAFYRIKDDPSLLSLPIFALIIAHQVFLWIEMYKK